MLALLGQAAEITRLSSILRALTRKRVAILLYHDPSPEVFECHLEYLSKRYNFVPYSEVVSALLMGNWDSLPSNPLVVHLDDGYQGNEKLSHICHRYGVVPTLYLCSHVVGTSRRFWSKLAGGTSKKLRLVSNELLLDKLDREARYQPDREYDEREALSAQQLAAMKGQFEFQSHGRYHFSLITLADDSLEADLEESRQKILSLTGASCEHFSFPYGDFGKREITAVKDAGYVTARTTLPGWVGPQCNPYRIPIVADVPGDASAGELALYVTGIPRFIKRLAYRAVTRHYYAWRQKRLMARRFFRTGD